MSKGMPLNDKPQQLTQPQDFNKVFNTEQATVQPQVGNIVSLSDIDDHFRIKNHLRTVYDEHAFDCKPILKPDPTSLPPDIDTEDLTEFISAVEKRLVKGCASYSAYSYLKKDETQDIAEEFLDIAAYALFGWLKATRLQKLQQAAEKVLKNDKKDTI